MEKRYFGSHDISHCNGRYCKMKESCKRYLAHLDLIDRNMNSHYTYIIINPDHIDKDGKCDCYWKNV